MDSYVRGASFGSVLWAVDSSLTVSNCWPVPYYTQCCELRDRAAAEVPEPRQSWEQSKCQPTTNSGGS